SESPSWVIGRAQCLLATRCRQALDPTVLRQQQESLRNKEAIPTHWNDPPFSTHSLIDHWVNRIRRAELEPLIAAPGNLYLTKEETGRTVRVLEKDLAATISRQLHHKKREMRLELCAEATPNKKPRRNRGPSLTPEQESRNAGIRAATKEGLKGRAYAQYLDRKGITPRLEWRHQGCPVTYPAAYNNPYWRHAMQREKSRESKRPRV